MKKLAILIFVVSIIVACKSTPPPGQQPPPLGLENPGVSPELTVTMGEMVQSATDYRFTSSVKSKNHTGAVREVFTANGLFLIC